MILRSYSGRSIAEALAKVKTDLGDRALIIETRSVRGPGLAGGTVGYEVVAALEQATPTSAVRPAAVAAHLAAARIGETTAVTRPAVPAVAAPASTPAADIEDRPLTRELAAIRAELSRLALGRPTTEGDDLGDVGERLREAELPDELLREVAQAVAGAGDRLPVLRRRDFIRAWLARALPCPAGVDWDQVRHLLVVGATGVGKTTTLAKLAADLVHQRGKRIGIITIDTYRVGAEDQLRAFADLLDVPLVVASTPAQFAKALEGFADRDHVLIDTAGRSPADTARVHELKAFCRAAATSGAGVAVALAISATCGRAEFAAVVERFSLLPLTHTIITKLDECAAPGRLYGCLRRHQLTPAYLTTGQEVPQDIRPGGGDAIVDAILALGAAASA